MIEKIKDNKKIMPIITVFLIILVVVGITYAWLVQRSRGSDNKIKISAATGLSLELTDEANTISIDKAIPMSDSQGLATTAYTFKVKNKGKKADYSLYLDDVDLESGETRIPDSDIKYSITRNGGNDEAISLTSTHQNENNTTVREIDHTIINEGTAQNPVVNTYTLKVWINSETTTAIAGKKFKAKIRLEGVQTEDSLDDKYEVSGYIYDDNNDPVPNATVAVYSNPKYTTTDSEGKFTVKGLEFGTHNVYYVPGKTVSEVQSMTKEQIENTSGVGKANVKTGDGKTTADLTNGYSISGMQKAKLVYNKHIKAAYTYNQNGTGSGTSYTGCLGGAEAGCQERELSLSATYPRGTIVKYEVAPNVIKYFNVLYDNGDTLTMQQRENTATAAKTSTISQGVAPTAVITALENATSSWVYVNQQSFTYGATPFGTGSYRTSNNGFINNAYLSRDQATSVWYTLQRTNVRARLISANETGEMSCLHEKDRQQNQRTCLKFMHNYLASSNQYGTSYQTDSTDYYYTSSMDSTYQYLRAVSNGGNTSWRHSGKAGIGLRAVVVVDK